LFVFDFVIQKKKLGFNKKVEHGNQEEKMAECNRFVIRVAPCLLTSKMGK
jgi:hypothetical protein